MSARAKRVLIVEDDDQLREVLTEILSDAGHVVTSAREGRPALEWLEGHGRPDLVLLDAMMLVMDGREFVRELLSRPELATIPIVLMSASAATPVDGARAFLRKPMSIDGLLEAVATHAD